MSELRTRLLENYRKDVIQTTQRSSPLDYDRMARRYRKIFGPMLPSDRSARVLDVGCGDGYFLHYLREEGFTNLEGIDSSEDRVEVCRRVTARVYKAEASGWLARHPGEYDLVTCHHLIEHFPDDELMPFAAALAGAIRPRGRLIITTPNACTPWAAYNLYHDLTHCRLFTADSLIQLMAAVGLETSVHPEAAVPFDFPSTLRWMAWKWREALLKAWFRIELGGTRGSQTTPLIVAPNLIAVCRRRDPVTS